VLKAVLSVLSSHFKSCYHRSFLLRRWWSCIIFLSLKRTIKRSPVLERSIHRLKSLSPSRLQGKVSGFQQERSAYWWSRSASIQGCLVFAGRATVVARDLWLRCPECVYRARDILVAFWKCLQNSVSNLWPKRFPNHSSGPGKIHCIYGWRCLLV
jgi:hypothetical protein